MRFSASIIAIMLAGRPPCCAQEEERCRPSTRRRTRFSSSNARRAIGPAKLLRFPLLTYQDAKKRAKLMPR